MSNPKDEPEVESKSEKLQSLQDSPSMDTLGHFVKNASAQNEENDKEPQSLREVFS